MQQETIQIEGLTVRKVRLMTPGEIELEGWSHDIGSPAPHVIEFHGGIRIYPSRDPEGNGPGVLFGQDEKDGTFAIF